jgi:hypothetical protein
MNDTTRDASQYVKKMMKRKSGQQRLMMGFSMFSTARLIVIESLKAKAPHLSAKKLKEKLFLRFYGSDFNQDTKDKILTKLRTDPSF